MKTFLQATEYGLIVCNTPIHKQFPISEFTKLIQKLNEFVKGRFAVLPLTQTSNYLGLYPALSKIVGKDMQRLIPNSDHADLAIVFGGEYLRDEYSVQPTSYSEKKLILLDNFKSSISKNAFITIPFAIPGIESNGTAIRMDGVNVDLHGGWKKPDENVKTIARRITN